MLHGSRARDFHPATHPIRSSRPALDGLKLSMAVRLMRDMCSIA